MGPFLKKKKKKNKAANLKVIKSTGSWFWGWLESKLSLCLFSLFG